MRSLLRVAVLIALVPQGVPAQGVAEPQDYREAPYRAPVPPALSGATTVDTEAAHDLWEGGNVTFVDVLPRAERPAGLPEGTIWRDAPRESIPGAIWLPNVGYAALPHEDELYLQNGLATATGGDPTHPVLFFCLTDCWMSWNAAKRTLALGYSEVFWYPDGTDGWGQAGHPLAPIEPLVLQ